MPGVESRRHVRAAPTPVGFARAATGAFAALAVIAGIVAAPLRATIPAQAAAAPTAIRAYPVAAPPEGRRTVALEPADAQPDPVGSSDPPTGTPPPSDPPPSTAPPSDPPPTGTPPPSDPPPTTTTPTIGPPLDPGPSWARPPQPPTPGKPRRGVSVTTGDLTLPAAYWHRASTVVELAVTVANSGDVPESVRLGYRLPPGLTDAGTPGCAPAGDRGYRCGAWHTAPGARFGARIRVRVDGDAWRQLPLSGSVEVSAHPPGYPGLPPVTDGEGFAVLFPAGPPVAGMSLSASEVGFDVTGHPSTLTIRLGNTGGVDATGGVEVILPAGVSVPAPPAGCRPAGGRTACALGRIRAGGASVLRLPIAATDRAQRSAPLSGAVVGTLAPAAGRAKQMRMSFRIVAAAGAAARPSLAGAGPTGSQGLLSGGQPPASRSDGLTRARQTAISLIAASVLLILLALALAVTSSRRRLAGHEPVAGAPPRPDQPWRAGAERTDVREPTAPGGPGRHAGDETAPGWPAEA